MDEVIEREEYFGDYLCPIPSTSEASAVLGSNNQNLEQLLREILENTRMPAVSHQDQNQQQDTLDDQEQEVQNTESKVRKRGRKNRAVENPRTVIWQIPRAVTWEDSVKQWHEGIAEARIPPLKDWTVDQINAKTEIDLVQSEKKKRGSQKGRKTTYWRRKVIGSEYERLGRVDFMNQYGPYLLSQDNLVNEICRRTALVEEQQ